MESVKYIGLDVHQSTISVAVLNAEGKVMMQSVIATKASAVLDLLKGLRGVLHLTFEEGTYSAWLYDVVVREVTGVVVCNPRKNALLKSATRAIRSMRENWRNCCGQGCCRRCITGSRARTPYNNW